MKKLSNKPSKQNKAALNERLFVGVAATGIIYADKSIVKHGDYARVAILFFDTLKMKFEEDCAADLAELIKKDAAEIQARKGQQYRVSASGQTITLGYAIL